MTDTQSPHDILYEPITVEQRQTPDTSAFRATGPVQRFNIVGEIPPAYIVLEPKPECALIKNTGFYPVYIALGVAASRVQSFRLDPGLLTAVYLNSYISVCTDGPDKTTTIDITPGEIAT